MLNIKGMLKQSGVFTKFLTLTGFFCFFTLGALFIWNLVSYGDRSGIISIKIMQAFQTTGMFILPSLACAYLWSEKPLAFLNLNKKVNGGHALLLILTILLAIPFINLLSEFNQQMQLPKALSSVEAWMKASELQARIITEKLLKVSTLDALLLNILLISVLPAIGEELFFRGAIQGLLKSWKGPIVAIWFTAFIFSTIHFQFYGFFPRLLLGALFGYLLIWSGNLWLPILAHFVNNFVAVIFYYLNGKVNQTLNIDTIGTGDSQWLGMVSAAVLIINVYMLRKLLKPKPTNRQ